MRTWIQRTAFLIFIAGVVFISICLSTANGEMTVKDYKKVKAHQGTPELLKAYCMGLGDGISWADLEVGHRTGKSLYCPPGKLALGVDNYIRILDDEIIRLEKEIGSEKMEKAFIGLILKEGFIRTFPCGENEGLPSNKRTP